MKMQQQAASPMAASPGRAAKLAANAAEAFRRIAIPAVGLLGAGLYVYGLPVFYDTLLRDCIDSACEAFYNPPPGTAWLQEHHISPPVYAMAYTLIYLLFGLVHFAAAAVLYRTKRRDWMGLLGMLTLVSFGITFPPVLSALPDVHAFFGYAVAFFNVAGITTYVMFFSLFPNGRAEPGWTKWLAALIIGLRIPGMIFPGSAADIGRMPWMMVGWLLLWTGGMVGILAFRYRTLMGPLERQQTKWVVYGLALGVSGLLGQTVLYVMFEARFQANPYYLYLLEIGIHGAMLLIPATLMIALLRRRLWDIDPLVNRTLVYGFLTLCIAGMYVAAVWYIGNVLQSRQSLLVSLIATGLVAVLFAPLKEKLQRFANRMMYGDQDDPSSVLGKLGERLKEPMPPDAVLQLVARTIREALRLPYSSLSILQQGEILAVVRDGTPPAETEGMLRLPLVHRGEELGVLEAAPRSRGESFTASDTRFLELLSRQAGAVVQGLKASMELKLLAEELQESRERLVMAREEERRRLRGNLHDDLAPRLASLALTAAAAENLLDSDPSSTRTILTELRSTIRSTIEEIRGLVHDLRPPALDELGLLGALKERMEDLTRLMKRVRGESGEGVMKLELLAQPPVLPPLPAAVEVAAYRIVTEAIVNAVKHAAASRCTVRVRLEEGEAHLELEITDNGRGIQTLHAESASGTPAFKAAAPDGSRGVGLHSMRERAAELGGTFAVGRLPEGGTRIWACLPARRQTAEPNGIQRRNSGDEAADLDCG